MYPLSRPHAPQPRVQCPKYTFSAQDSPQKYSSRYTQGPISVLEFLLYKALKLEHESTRQSLLGILFEQP